MSPRAPASRNSWICSVSAALIFVARVTAYAEFKYQLFPRRLGTVVEGKFYRSGQIDQSLIGGVLDDLGIERVILLHGFNPDDPDHHAEMAAIEQRGIEYRRFEMSGNGQGSVEQYAEVVALLAEASRDDVVTLVHCGAGTQRTGGTVAAYRLLVEQADPKAVTREAMKYDWDPHDESSVWAAFLNQNMGSIAQNLVDRGILDSVPDPLPVFYTE